MALPANWPENSTRDFTPVGWVPTGRGVAVAGSPAEFNVINFRSLGNTPLELPSENTKVGWWLMTRRAPSCRRSAVLMPNTCTPLTPNGRAPVLLLIFWTVSPVFCWALVVMVHKAHKNGESSSSASRKLISYSVDWSIKLTPVLPQGSEPSGLIRCTNP